MRVPVHLTCLQRPLDGQPLHALFASRWRSSRRLVSAVSTCLEISLWNALKSFLSTFCSSACQGALLHGPPGTGKTRLLQPFREAGFYELFWGVTANINSRYVGETEQKLMQLANSASDRPHLLHVFFFDEIETHAKKRTLQDSECPMWRPNILHWFVYICTDKLKISRGQQKTKTSLLSYVSFTTGIVAAMLQSMLCSSCSRREKRHETRVELSRFWVVVFNVSLVLACLFSHSSSSFRQVICIDARSS